jgi:hypothetical protein
VERPRGAALGPPGAPGARAAGAATAGGEVLGPRGERGAGGAGGAGSPGGGDRILRAGSRRLPHRRRLCGAARALALQLPGRRLEPRGHGRRGLRARPARARPRRPRRAARRGPLLARRPRSGARDGARRRAHAGPRARQRPSECHPGALARAHRHPRPRGGAPARPGPRRAGIPLAVGRDRARPPGQQAEGHTALPPDRALPGRPRGALARAHRLPQGRGAAGGAPVRGRRGSGRRGPRGAARDHPAA